MYRHATLAVYDVLDTVFINAQVVTHEGTPGDSARVVTTYSASVNSVGREDDRIWLWEALQELQEQLDQK